MLDMPATMGSFCNPTELPSRGLKILLAEDSLTQRKELAEILRRKGCKVLLATSGKGAVTTISRPNQQISIALMDIKMPGRIDGIEAASQIQREHPETEIIFLTAFANDSEYRNRVEKSEMRVNDWVSKPVTGKNKKRLFDGIDRSLQKIFFRRKLVNYLNGNTNSMAIRFLLEQANGSYGSSFLREIIRDIKQIFQIEYDSLKDVLPYINFFSYQDRKREFEKNFPGEFLAFLDGDMVENCSTRKELIKKVYNRFGRTDIFIVEVGKQDKVIRFRRPMRAIQSPHDGAKQL